MTDHQPDDSLTFCGLVEAFQAKDELHEAWTALLGRPFDSTDVVHRVLMLALAGAAQFIPANVVASLRQGALS